jgi:hypothetical protein
MAYDENMSGEEEESGTLYQDLFSGKQEKALIGINPWSTCLWRRDDWEPLIGKEKYDSIQGCGVYEVTHQDFAKICEEISDYHVRKDCVWKPSPAEVAESCDEAGTGNRWFRMSDAFTEYVGRATPKLALEDFVD